MNSSMLYKNLSTQFEGNWSKTKLQFQNFQTIMSTIDIFNKMYTKLNKILTNTLNVFGVGTFLC